MARIAWVNIPDNKKIKISLRYIYWIWPNFSDKILGKLNIDWEIRVKDLTDDQIDLIRNEISSWYLVEVEKKREESLNIKRLKDIRCFRGIRHLRGLPTRWQRTKTNAKTARKRSWKKKNLVVAKKK